MNSERPTEPLICYCFGYTKADIIAELESTAGQDPAVLGALVRARSRIREVWVSCHRRRRGGKGAPAAPSGAGREAERKRLSRLHRISVRLDSETGRLPGGGWLWVLPEGLRPYTELRGWQPPPGRKRFCQGGGIPRRHEASRDLGRRARERVHAEFDVARTVRETRELYASLSGRR